MIFRALRRRRVPASRTAAVREAAHALVAHLHGMRVSEIRLEPDEDGHDLLDGLRYSLDAVPLRHDPEGHFLVLLKKAEVALAGQVATAELLAVESHGPGEAVAIEIAERLCPSAGQRDALLDLARARLRDLLAAERTRASLYELAERLERERVIRRDALQLAVLRGVKLPD